MERKFTYCEKSGHLEGDFFKKKNHMKNSDNDELIYGITSHTFECNSDYYTLWVDDCGESFHVTNSENGLKNIVRGDNDHVMDGGGTTYIITYTAYFQGVVR